MRDGGGQSPVDFQVMQKTARKFDDADSAHLVNIEQDGHTGLPHIFAAGAFHHQAGRQVPQGPSQVSPMQVARRFPRNDKQSERFIIHIATRGYIRNTALRLAGGKTRPAPGEGPR